MAFYEGSCWVEFDLSEMSKKEKEEFKRFLEKQKEKCDPDEGELAWLFALKSDEGGEYYEGSDECTDEETVGVTYQLLRKAAKKFPKLRAEGSGGYACMVAEDDGVDFSFTLADGELDWTDNMDEDEDEDD